MEKKIPRNRKKEGNKKDAKKNVTEKADVVSQVTFCQQI